MAMAVDSRQHPQHFSTMGYDTMRYQPNPSPHFTNPWGSAAPTQGHLYQTSLPQQEYKANVSAAYPSGQISAPVMPAGVYPADPALLTYTNLQMAQDALASRPFGAAYTSAPSINSYAPTSAPQYGSTYGYNDRRTSHP